MSKSLISHDVPALACSKEKRYKNQAQIPITKDLAKELKEYFKDNPAMPHTRVFLRMYQDKGAAMLRPDLALAKIEYTTRAGTADFHSLRHTFISLLVNSGVLPQYAQKLARHSSIVTTMKHYAHIEAEENRKAINQLPTIKILKPTPRKTGTYDGGE